MSSTKKVLMVDDEDQFRATTKKLLSRRGFETILAGSGEEAIEYVKEHPVDLIVLDMVCRKGSMVGKPMRRS